MLNKTRGRGRPPGESRTREEILAVARRRFFADGYDGVSLRSIAEEAGVDVALISYHFGSKKGLFGAALALSANPAELLARELAGPLNSLPERLVRRMVTVWDDPATGGPLRTFLTGVVRDPDLARLFREAVEREIVARIAERIGGPDATKRAGVAVSQIVGLLMTRYVLRLEPIATMPVGELSARLGPMLRAALIGPRPATRRRTLDR